VPAGLVSGFPVASRTGRYEIVQGLQIDQRGRDGIDRSMAELLDERDVVAKYGLVRTN
jgi:malate dehydrogenase